MTEITGAFVSRTGEWPSLSIQWEGQETPVAVVMSHPNVWHNGIVSVDVQAPTLQAFMDPDDENSTVIEVENGLVAPQAAALALQVYAPGFEVGSSTPHPIEIPTMADARRAIRK